VLPERHGGGDTLPRAGRIQTAQQYLLLPTASQRRQAGGQRTQGETIQKSGSDHVLTLDGMIGSRGGIVRRDLVVVCPNDFRWLVTLV